MPHEEQQYLELIREILARGTLEKGRNGNTLSVFGRSMRFSLADGQIPILTTKQVAWKTCAKELFWFLSGSTDNGILQKQGVGIWNGNATREYLDSRGLTDYQENELGPIYGYQWRHFGLPYQKRCDKEDGTNTIDETETKDLNSKNAKKKGIDQIQQIIETLRDPEQRSSRRIILTAWNPLQLDEMALPPCHILAQFNVRDGTYLSCAMYQRSGDVGLGVPFNIASYSLLTHILAKHTGLVAEEFVYFLGNAHVYEEHVEALKIQVEREPFLFPKIKISDINEDLAQTIENYTLENIVFQTPYQYHPSIKMDMKV
jgi:thymidylate synthase